jgi:hypothetical protein
MVRYAYRIEGLEPPFEFDRIPNYGFNVFLDRDFALNAKKDLVGQRAQERLQEIAAAAIKRMFYRQLIGQPYHFLGDSMLITSCQVPGDNNCELLIGRDQIDSLERKNAKSELHYYTHNVDNRDQVYGLLSLFTRWCEYAGLSR